MGESIEEYDGAIFELTHLITERVIDRLVMSVERAIFLNSELREAELLFRWHVRSDDVVMARLYG